MMKKTYKNPEIEVQLFHTEDIITTSGLEDKLKSEGVQNIKDVRLSDIFNSSTIF